MAPTQEAETFLGALFESYPQGQKLTDEIRTLPPRWRTMPQGERPPRSWFYTEGKDLERASRYCTNLAPEWDVYTGVLPRKGCAGSQSDVQIAAWMWCDVDGGEDGPDGSVALVKASGIPLPNIAVVSGGGLHIYWRLCSPVALVDDPARAWYKSLLVRICLKIGGASPAPHADTSGAEVARILRVPGTFNLKQQDNPRPVKLVSFKPDRNCMAVQEWDALLPPAPAAPPQRPHRSVDPDKGISPGLVRWAQTGHPEGNRHHDLASDAAWLVRTAQVGTAVAEQLLTMKAQASPGGREITDEEIRKLVRWA